MKPKVLLTDNIHPTLRPVLEARCDVVVAPDATPPTIARLIADVDAVIVRNKLAPDVFDGATRLRAVVRHGVGLDMIPVEAATARGIPVANLPGSNTAAVVEYCLAAMLDLRRNLPALDGALRSRGWAQARPLADSGRELRGSVLGIVGVGAIGAQVGIVGAAMGMRVLGLTRRADQTLPAGMAPATKAELFGQADVVVLSCPLNDQTRGLLDAATLASMKPGAIVINVSRGPVVDTPALIAALREGRLGGAALDVHDRQPLAPDDPVFDAPNVLLTPHVAGVTATSLLAMSRGAVDTTLALLRGERPANVVNPEVFMTQAQAQGDTADARRGAKPPRIADIRAVPISFPVPPEHSVTLGIGRSVKRDAVLVRVESSDGHVGWGEAHHGRAPGAMAKLIDTTIRELVLGMDAFDTNGVWARVFKMQIASHGMGAAAVLALSGLDLALWDLRCQDSQWPLVRMLGGTPKPIKAYAGGIALGYQAPASLVEEARGHVAAGYRALKLRVGDTAVKDIARVQAVRAALGDEIEILVDANTAYTLADVQRVMPAFEEARVGWLEEPFAPMDRRAYAAAARLGRVPLAAGENHYTRYEFDTLLQDGHVGYVQPDLSKTGGITEAMRIAAMASALKLTVNPHTSATAINMSTSIHYLSAVDNPGYFEGDVTVLNPFRDQLGDRLPYVLDDRGCVTPLDGVGIGLKIDTAFIADHPLIDGPCYV